MRHIFNGEEIMDILTRAMEAELDQEVKPTDCKLVLDPNYDYDQLVFDASCVDFVYITEKKGDK